MKNKKYPKPHSVIDKLLRIMKDRNIKQETLAEYAKVSPSQMSRILSGKVQISIWQFADIASGLKMQITDIHTYPDIYEKVEEGRTHKILVEVEIELTDEEVERIDLKNKVKNKINL